MMTKSAWKKDPNTARPQRTTPANKRDNVDPNVTADGKRKTASKPKKPANNNKKPKKSIGDGITKAFMKRRRGKSYGMPITRKRAEKVLR